jgi:hypothetical protein
VQVTPSSQFTGVQTPAWQVEHRSPSVQAELSGAFGLEHKPVAGLQVPATWHWSSAAQVTGLTPAQLPPWSQVKAPKHRSPLPGQAWPTWAGSATQVPLAWSQVWQGGQESCWPGTHVPLPSQASPTVHELLSLQGVPAGLGVFWQPLTGSQVAV